MTQGKLALGTGNHPRVYLQDYTEISLAKYLWSTNRRGMFSFQFRESPLF